MDKPKPKQMSEEDLEAARYAVDSGDSAEADFTEDHGPALFAHIEWQAARIRELEQSLGGKP